MTSDSVRSIQARARFIYEELYSEIANRDWRQPARPWSEFVDKFTLPKKDPKSIANRIVLNSHLYQTNYCIILGAALLYYILRRPFSLFVVGCIIVAWVYATSPKPILINGRRITRQQRFLTVAIGSFLVLAFSGVLFSVVRVFLPAIVLILLHASLRHTSMRHKVGEIRTHMADRW